LNIQQINSGACSGPDGWILDPASAGLVSYNPTTGESIAEISQATGLKDQISRIGTAKRIQGLEDKAKKLENVIARQEKEIEEIKLFDLEEIPKRLAFEHSSMIRDYVNTLKEG